MNNNDRDFLIEMFLDDSVCTTNRLIVATANVLNENIENVYYMNEALLKEHNSHVSRLNPPKKPLISKNVKGYFYEHRVKNFTENEYLEHFKILRSTVKALITFLEDCVKPDSSIVPLDKKAHVFLYLLTNCKSFSEVGVMFGLHKSSVSYIFHEIASILSEHRYHFITWPSLDEQHVTRMKVNSRFGFPNCVGFIDACRLKVGPKRKHNCKSEIVLLQAVCDETLMFIDVYVGDIGNTKKNRVFRESLLAQELKNFIEFENHILGDSEYKLRKNLITPYIHSELLTSDEMRFNEIHWNSRSYIGHAFQMLRDRFNKINHIDINKSDSVKTLIYAACALHNFILLKEGSPQLKEETVLCSDGVTIDTTLVKTAAEKRQFLCNYINFVDNT